MPPTARAASDGQMVRGARWPTSASTTARSRAERPFGVGSSHHGSPRSPSATFACCTRRRAIRSASGSAALRARATSRLAAMSSSMSSWRNGSGIDGSVARHRRPSTTIQCDSSPRAAVEQVAISHQYPIGTAQNHLGDDAPVLGFRTPRATRRWRQRRLPDHEQVTQLELRTSAPGGAGCVVPVSGARPACRRARRREWRPTS